MINYEHTARQAAKSKLANAWKEAALDAGMTVFVVTPEGTTRQRRKKHLTEIKTLKPKQEMTVIYDET